MMHIAVCDDEDGQLQVTYQMVRDFLAQRRLPAKVWEFSSGRELLNTVAEVGAFDLYILDIVMPDMTGIDLGLELRKTDKDGAIIYLTTSPDFALASYQARAFFYLLKPVSRQTLFDLLDEAVGALTKRQEEAIQVRTRNGTVRLLLDSLLYAELKNRAVRYYLRDGTSVDSMTMSGSFREAVSPLLEDERFILCGASFVVNLYHIKMVVKSGVVLSDGRSLGLPKSACAALRTAWSDYWLEGGRKL